MQCTTRTAVSYTHLKEAEALRVTAEQGRVNAENTRVSNENTRISNEDQSGKAGGLFG